MTETEFKYFTFISNPFLDSREPLTSCFLANTARNILTEIQVGHRYIEQEKYKVNLKFNANAFVYCNKYILQKMIGYTYKSNELHQFD